jgi:AcrR family transcriptional regulator
VLMDIIGEPGCGGAFPRRACPNAGASRCTPTRGSTGERILTVAYAAFGDDPDVSLNAIGKLAGVGADTLYRDFPTREELILVVYGQELHSLVEAIHDIVVPPTGRPRAGQARSWRGTSNGRGAGRGQRDPYVGH